MEHLKRYISSKCDNQHLNEFICFLFTELSLLCAEEKKTSHAKFGNKIFQLVHATNDRAYLLKMQNFIIHNYLPQIFCSFHFKYRNHKYF